MELFIYYQIKSHLVSQAAVIVLFKRSCNPKDIMNVFLCVFFPGKEGALCFSLIQEWTCSPVGLLRSLMSPSRIRGSTAAMYRTATCQSLLNWRCSVSDTQASFHFFRGGSVLLCDLASPPDRTVILSMPRELKVQPGNEALFPCNALVDSNFRDPQILWRKDNQKLQESISDTKWGWNYIFIFHIL